MRRMIWLFLLTVGFPAAAEVWFIPGWRTGFDGRAGCVVILKDIFPNRTIKVKSWDSRRPWPVARRNAEVYTETLFREISALPDARLRELILIGHSVGARITLNILSRLAVQGRKVHSAALLAAVVPCDSPQIPMALHAVRFEICNICNPGDLILKYLYPLDRDQAAPLGYSGWVGRDPRFIEAVSTHNGGSFYFHFAYLYLEELRRRYRNLPPRVEIPGADTAPRFPADTLFWSDVEVCEAWRLQRHYDGRARILDPSGVRRISGSAERMRETFADIRRQLTALEK